jgi:sugar phosphate isomerase/epimerase
MGEEELVASLAQFSRLADGIVMHPDTMDDLRLYRPLGHKLLLENMDSRKPDGRTPEELHRAFAELPEAGFCFDIAHAWSVDPSMAVANEILDNFCDRLRHVHLSSLSEDLHHVSLTEEDEELFSSILRRCLDVPWIFEAPPQTDPT